MPLRWQLFMQGVAGRPGWPSRLLAGMILLGLTGCQNLFDVRIGIADIANNYQPETLGLVTADGRALKLVMVGNPFPGVPFATSRDAAAAAVESAVTTWPLRLSPEPADPWRPESRYRLLLLFDPPPRVSGLGLCRRDDLRPREAGPDSPRAGPDSGDAGPDSGAAGSGAARPGGLPERIRVVGVYCRGHRTLTRAVGSATRGAGPEDRRFRQLMAQMGARLFPSINHNLENDRRCRRFFRSCR